MEKISINNGKQYDIKSILPVSPGVLQITFAGQVPDAWGDIYLYTEGDELATVLYGYDTLLDVNAQVVQVSCDGNAHSMELPSADPQTPYYKKLEQQISDMQAQNYSMRKAMTFAAVTFTDEQAAQVPELYDIWNGNGVQYEVGVRVNYNRTMYKVLQNHTSQPDWAPDAAPSLFAEVLVPEPEAGPVGWEQPGSTNPYMKGDKVIHNGKTWESQVDNNVWEPGAVGTETLWKEV